MAEDEDASDSGSTASSSRPPSPRGQWWPERAPAQLSPASVDHLAQAESWTAGAAARVAAAQSNRRRGAGPTVYLNVYDLSNVGGTDLTGTLASLNRTLMRSWDVGLFHAGVEVAGVEYSYGYCEEGTGVFACEPRDACGAKFRQAIPMGRAPSDARIIERRLARLVATWPGDAYALLQRNCCHFCDALCRSLGVGPIPAWVNGLAASVRGATEFTSVWNQISGAPRHRRDVVPVTASTRWRGGSRNISKDDLTHRLISTQVLALRRIAGAVSKGQALGRC
jgi:hypothetical protein